MFRVVDKAYTCLVGSLRLSTSGLLVMSSRFYPIGARRCWRFVKILGMVVSIAMASRGGAAATSLRFADVVEIGGTFLAHSAQRTGCLCHARRQDPLRQADLRVPACEGRIDVHGEVGPPARRAHPAPRRAHAVASALSAPLMLILISWT